MVQEKHRTLLRPPYRQRDGPLPHEFIPSMMMHAGFNTALTCLCWGMQIAVCTLVLLV